MKREELNEITQAIEASAEKGITKALLSLGVDIHNPIEVQKDLAFSRKQRMASEKVTQYTRLALIGLVVSGLSTVLVLGLKQVFK